MSAATSAAEPAAAPRGYIVTAAGGGIGGALARRLLRSGAHVVGADLSTRRLAGLETAAAELGAGTLHTVKADVTSEADVAELISRSIDHLGTIHGVANVAGGMIGIKEQLIDTPLQDVSLENFREMMALNLEGMFLMCKEVEPHMAERGYGKIANVSSLAAFGNRLEMGNIPYNAAKAGVIGLSRTLSMSLGAVGIRVNVVAPGLILSDRVAETFGQGYIDRHVAQSPIDTLATVDDVAAGLAYFLGPDSDQVTGEVLRVAGGIR